MISTMRKTLIPLCVVSLFLPLGMQSITPIQAAATIHARAAYDRHESIDPAIIQMIHDVVEQIAVPSSIADYAREQDWDKVMELAQKPGVNVNAQDEKGRTAFMYALSSGKDDIAWFFLNMQDEHGKHFVDLKIKDSAGSTALMYIACFGLLELFKYLIEQKDESNNWIFDLNDRDVYGESIFLMAVGQFGNLEIVRYLAEIKKSSGRNRVIDLNARNSAGYTALMRATICGRLDIVRYLMQIKDSHGKRVINVYARDRQGYTALDLASQSIYSTQVAEIRDYLVAELEK